MLACLLHSSTLLLGAGLPVSSQARCRTSYMSYICSPCFSVCPSLSLVREATAGITWYLIAGWAGSNVKNLERGVVATSWAVSLRASVSFCIPSKNSVPAYTSL